VDVEGSNNGDRFEEVREHLIDLGILLPVVAFGILFGIPKAERQNTILLGVRGQNCSSTNPACFFRIGRTFSSISAHGSRAFSGLVVSSTTLVYMGDTPFRGRKLKGSSRSRRDVHVVCVEFTSTYAYSLSGQLLKNSTSGTDGPAANWSSE
jgi:hypothetical protein